MGWFTKRVPVYSDVGEKLYQMLTKEEDKWEYQGNLILRYPSLWVSVLGHKGSGFIKDGVSITGAFSEGTVTCLTRDDISRLYKTIVDIVNRKNPVDKGNNWIRKTLGLKEQE